LKYTVEFAEPLLNEQDEFLPEVFHKIRAKDREQVRRRYGTLYSDFEARASLCGLIIFQFTPPFFSVYWEVFDMVRKMLLTGALIFVAKGTVIQVGIGIERLFFFVSKLIF